MEVAFLFQGQVASPAVGVNHAVRDNGVLHKRHEALGGGIRYAAHSNSPDSPPIRLSGHLNLTQESVSSRPHHRGCAPGKIYEII